MCRSNKENSRAEVAAAEARGRAEAEKAALQAALDAALESSHTQQASLQATIQRLVTDARDYKVCGAHKPIACSSRVYSKPGLCPGPSIAPAGLRPCVDTAL